MNLTHTALSISGQDALNELFNDIKPALTERQALLESARCLYCYDAPCIKACPSDINIPSFITQIHAHNNEGAAKVIYENNILGGSCARVCPTEILCEESCVRNKEAECSPVLIGQLQRFATDNARFVGHPFAREATTGKKIAIIGAGPAGLSCAHRLALKGHEVEIFEANQKAGGLNEYGIAKYKLTDNFAQKEVDFILGVGGITLHTNKALGKDINLKALTAQFDAVFLAIGLQNTRQLMLANENATGMQNAVDYIKVLRQSTDISALEIPVRAVVIGAGNTAIDIACQLRRLGTQDVTLVYRRGEADMGATSHEQMIARDHQVRIRTWSRPDTIITDASGAVTAMRFRRTHIESGSLTDTEHTFDIPCEAVFKAVGQTLHTPIDDNYPLHVSSGKVEVDKHFKTNIGKVFAGGDCTQVGQDLTVEAVQQGKLAALSIHDYLLPSSH